MDYSNPLKQHFNGGIIFLSYIIAVFGAQTTLELLMRRTHFRGAYNWFLLVAAAFTMGGVCIWSMHFVGNNSLKLTLDDNNHFQLSYSVGYTCISLAVAVTCMFIAFISVGITEEAKVYRIIPSGIFVGIGITAMHYLGQFAIESFILHYRLSFVGGAIAIACVASTAALYIFFKLREQWANQWYKRLACSMLMGLAVCGMHYTALAGTNYYLPKNTNEPATPALDTGTLVGTISAIVVAACIVICYFAFRGKDVPISVIKKKKDSRQLILGVVYFDYQGRILVRMDGIVPTKEVAENSQLEEICQQLSNSHLFFIHLFQLVTQFKWAETRFSTFSTTPHTNNAFDMAENEFFEAAKELQQDLKLSCLSDLGLLFDNVIQTNTIVTKLCLFNNKKESAKPYSLGATRWLSWLSATTHTNSMKDEEMGEYHHSMKEISNKPGSVASEITIGHYTEDNTTKKYNQYDKTQSNHHSLCMFKANINTKKKQYLFLVKKIVQQKQIEKFLSLGYRFADPIYISKTMAQQLHISVNHMALYFKDMQYMAYSLSSMIQNVPPSITPIISSAVKTDTSLFSKQATKTSVYVGLLVLLQDNTNDICMLIDKLRRSSFPLVELEYKDESPMRLAIEEKSRILGLRGRALHTIASHERKYPVSASQTTSNQNYMSSSMMDKDTANNDGPLDNPLAHATSKALSPGHSYPSATNTQGQYSDSRFMNALQQASKQLVEFSGCNKIISTNAKLHSEIIDVPPFSLMVGACQLILFKAYVNTPGTVSTINEAISKPCKFIPLPLVRSLSFYITETTVELYQKDRQTYSPETSFLDQKRLYMSSASRNSYDTDTELLVPIERAGMNGNQSTSLTAYTHRQQDKHQDIVPSFLPLPPPPRAKKPRFTLPKFEFDHRSESHSLNGSGSNSNLKDISPVFLNVLPYQDRFLWLNTLVEDMLQVLDKGN
ncbi:hypothetical protein BDF14DRAFT_1755213 [Spinellus fusiger]|nr:hypothetical protein BDF14DRAFT_1755213 [Spinellus fusiger]